ncbi:hypothetical protein Taro_056545, partial [Colocasia esculenta]|nr:hypothetical protein [Colocasia esculenta]
CSYLICFLEALQLLLQRSNSNSLNRIDENLSSKGTRRAEEGDKLFSLPKGTFLEAWRVRWGLLMMDGQLGAFYTQKIPKIPFSVSTCPGGGVDTLSQILKQAVLGTDPVSTCFGIVSTCCPGSENSCTGSRIQCRPALVFRRPAIPNSENYYSGNKL